jgi:hypothetical protein
VRVDVIKQLALVEISLESIAFCAKQAYVNTTSVHVQMKCLIKLKAHRTSDTWKK